MRDVGECRIAVKEYLADPEGEKRRALASGGTSATRGISWKVAAPAAVVIALAAVFATSIVTRPTPEAPEIAKRFIHRLADGERMSTSGMPLAMSPNNEAIALMVVDEAGTRRLHVRRLDRLEGRYLDGTTGASTPFFSPDGRWVAFFQDQLKRISVDGGPPMMLSEIQVGSFWRRILGREQRDCFLGHTDVVPDSGSREARRPPC